ncbi:hypothetical protein [Sphingobacterium rhinopitheci]|uniref:hypothetical protein n=1 Tax=Sphingobacterium rhinopitheci TaxID=2781960 RepID=UPI001F51CDEC|nr:hypothetical protein [Sphingobacterium rhinopitheci]MCI0922607.1 hypothetical protein [Sphingobacterium rhinopitheci]
MEKTKAIQDYLTFQKKVQVLKYAQARGKSKEAYELFGVKKSTFYKWRKVELLPLCGGRFKRIGLNLFIYENIF